MDLITLRDIVSIDRSLILTTDNARALMALPDKCIDLYFGSPPYNLGAGPSAQSHPNSRRGSDYDNQGYLDTFNDAMPEDLYQALQVWTLNEMYRSLKPQGSVMYVHKDRLWDGTSISPRTWLERSLFKIRQQIIWDQSDTHMNHPSYFAPTYEYVFWLVRRDFTPYALPEYMKGIWRIPNNPDRQRKPKKGKPKHPAQFPPELAEAAVRQLTDPGDLVCDPWTGVGNTGLAAVRQGRRFLGFEINPYFAAEARDAVGSFTRALL